MILTPEREGQLRERRALALRIISCLVALSSTLLCVAIGTPLPASSALHLPPSIARVLSPVVLASSVAVLFAHQATARVVRYQAADPSLDALGAQPTVTTKSGTVVGSSLGGVDSFNGIPFAQPPVGPLRLKPPQPLNASFGTFDATGTAASCPQMYFSTSGNDILTQVLGEISSTPLFQTVVTDSSEDCLTVTVYRPSGTTCGAGLPVLFWIFGGGFELGATSMYNASPLITNAVSRGQPFIFVAVNYRLGGFGFLPGKEILADGSANLGLLDQRLGLQWTADNIAAFGGDPSKVTIWGESAGSISVLDQMALYGGNNTYNGAPLFRGAIMDSGSIVPADPVDCPKGQAVYDAVVSAGGCANAADTLACLRALPYATYLNAANSVPSLLSYNSIALSYLPRPDGTALPKSPDLLVEAGEYAAVPMIIGDQEDEGTIFSLFQANTTATTDLLVSYLSTIFFHDATTQQVQDLVATYPEDPSAGSPFRTGEANELYPGYKRLAAMLGDLAFTLTRRAFLAAAAAVNPSVPSWSYLASYDYGTAGVGSFHGGDILQVFYGVLPDYASASIQAYYFNFLYNLDPNDYTGRGIVPTGLATFPTWPKWAEGQQLLNFLSTGSALIDDNFRNESYAYMLANTAALHI